MILYQIFVGVILSIVFRGNGAVKEKATNLDLPIEKLSTISQMLSGISISNGFYTGHTDIYDVAAELLNMESGRSLYKFLKLDIDSMANGLQEFFDSIKNVQNISIDNPQEIENALRFLVEIKQYREILKPGGIEEKSAGKIRDELNRLHDAVYRLVEQSNPTYAAQLKAHLVTM